MNKIETSFLQTELNRVGEWIRFSDKKSAFLSVYYSTIFGILISQKEAIFKNTLLFENCFYIVFFLVFSISFFLGVFFLIKSIFPSLNHNLNKKSLFYFGDIATNKFINYLDDIKKLNEEDFKIQIIEQLYTNSIIANKKMQNVQSSSLSLIVSILAMSILSLFF